MTSMAEHVEYKLLNENIINTSQCKKFTSLGAPSIIPENSCETNGFEVKDICEEVLGNKMAALELTENLQKSNSAGDGSDSGVEIHSIPKIGLQRALSSNSGGYASSCCGGLDEINVRETLSCDSSMISLNSDIENKITNTIEKQNLRNECTSENGSESSSIIGGPIVRKTSVIKKKATISDSNSAKTIRRSDTSPNPIGSLAAKIRSRGLLNRQMSTTIAPSSKERERARSKEKTQSSPSTSKGTTPPFRSSSVRKPQKPDTLPSVIVSTSPSIQRLAGTKNTNVIRSKTPGTPPDDGRWPSIGGGRSITINSKRSGSAAPDLNNIKTRANMISLDTKISSALDKYGTLPRRRRQKSVEDLRPRSSRSSSASRDNKMISSVIGTRFLNITPPREITPSKMLPPFPKIRKQTSKTKIYHEISIQTVMTGRDIQNAFAGAAKAIKIDAIEMKTNQSQTDFRDKEIETLKEQIRQLNEKQLELQGSLNSRTQLLVNMEKQLKREHEEKIMAQQELHTNTERVLGMLEKVKGTPTEDNNYDSLLILESQIEMSGHELEQKQKEIHKLRKICHDLKMEMQRSLATQQLLLQEKVSIEKESNELQDFLQNEKTALCEALKDSEMENGLIKHKLEEMQSKIKSLEDERRHLVRVNEQKRQENKGLISKYGALETRIKDLITQQATAISGASMALLKLSSRLNSLVEQSISSYNISEQDLEDIIFHNEAYANSASSGNESPECETEIPNNKNEVTLSPQRNHSFIAAVINAIRSATTSSKRNIRMSKSVDYRDEEVSDSTEMLDSETEPCLMMDNVLEDVSMPDSHSQNLISSAGIMISQVETTSEIMNGEESLQNLSQAIANRQKIEKQINAMSSGQQVVLLKNQSESNICDDISGHDSITDIPSISDYCTAQALVDQVIDVDNLVTKLLKILRLTQMTSDSYMQKLISDKNKLQQNKEEMLERLKDLEDINTKLHKEFIDTSGQLILKNNDLSNSKTEMQRHRNEIDKLYDLVLKQSESCCKTICGLKYKASAQKPCATNHKLREDTATIADLIHTKFPKYDEMPLLSNNEFFNFDSKAISIKQPEKWLDEIIKETRRQYLSIDKTLEVLHSIQDIVKQYPALSKIQRNLEETNFILATKIPIYVSFLYGRGIEFSDDLNGNISWHKIKKQ